MGSASDFNVTGAYSGQSVPDWKRKIKLGVSASSPYTRSYYDVLSVGGPLSVDHKTKTWNQVSIDPPIWVERDYQTFKHSGYVLNLAAYGSSGFNPTTYPSSADEGRAASKLHDKIREDHSQASGPVFLGELRETVAMLRNPFQAARRATLSFLDTLNIQRGLARERVKPRRSDYGDSLDRRRAKSVMDGLAGSHLEFVFGLKPFISDVQDIVEAIDQTVNAREIKSRYRARQKLAPVTIVDVLSNASAWESAQQRVVKTRRTEASVQYVAIYNRKLSGSVEFLPRLRDALGFTPENFVPTIWELVPWSFLFDYFVNIGKILEARTTSQEGLITCVKTIRTVTTTHVDEALQPVMVGPRFNGQVFTSKFSGKTSTYRSFRTTQIVRTVQDSLPVPQLTFTVPGSGSLKWANMGALLYQTQISNSRLWR